MSTRSAVRIAGSSAGHLDLYRHWDGYPAEAGATLLAALKDTDRPEVVALRLLSEERGEGDLRPQYEITNADLHGDLEHVYVVERVRRSAGALLAGASPERWEITHYARRSFAQGGDDWQQWDKKGYTPTQFAALVNQDRREINGRIAQLRVQYPEQYKDTTDYPTVSA